MIETKDVLTRHKVIGLLEDATFAAKQYWGRECYLADQLSMLAYRIAEGEAGFVEDKGEVQAKAENQKDIVETMIDAYDDVMQGIITITQLENLISDLSYNEVKEIIQMVWYFKREWLREKVKRSEIPNETSGTYTHTKLDDEKTIYEDTYNICAPTLSTLSKDSPEGAQKPSDDEVRALLRGMMDNSTYDANNPTPKKVKNTIETIIDGLQKGILALNLIVELFSEETAAKTSFAKENNIPCTKAKIETKVEMGSERKREEVIGALKRIIEEVENDPETRREMEKAQRKYGTLTAEDLMKQFTI